MATYRDLGIPVKKAEVGEGALLLNVLTKGHGMVNANAPGARKLKSRKRGNFELGAVSRFSFAEGKNTDVVVEVELEEYFESLRNRKAGSLLTSRLCRLSNILFVSEEEEAYSLLRSTLTFADSVSTKVDDQKWHVLEQLIERWFEYAALRLSGLVEKMETEDLSEIDPKLGVKALSNKEILSAVRKLTVPVLEDIIPTRS